jgi:hypothetical protein
MKSKKTSPEFEVFGISPLGGNCQEGTSISGMPLIDTPYGFITEANLEIIQDREHALALAERTAKEASERRAMGYI